MTASLRSVRWLLLSAGLCGVASCAALCQPEGYFECEDSSQCGDAGLVCDGRTATCMYPEDIAARCVECATDQNCGMRECECGDSFALAQNTCVAAEGGCATCVEAVCPACPP